jgi:integrase
MSETTETTTTTSKAKASAAPSPLLNKHGKFDDRLITRCKPPSAAVRQYYASENLKDGLSLRMVFGRKRARWYVATYDEHGQTIQTPLGYFPLPGCKLLPVFDSEEARDAARELFKDPQRTVREKQAGTFGEVSREWFKVKIKGRGLRSEREIERRLKKYVWPAWEFKPFASIRKADVSLLLNQIQAQAQKGPRKYRGAVQADGVLSTLRAIFIWYSDFMHDSWTLPVSDTMKRSTKGKRKRKLDDAELKEVWTEAKTAESGEFGRFIRFLTLIPCRRSKVLDMGWSDVKGDTWFIPREACEKGAPSFIRLPKLALHLINEQRKRTGNGYSVWTCVALSRHKREFDKRVNAKRQQAGEPDIPHWTLHDLRRTNRSRMSKIKVNVKDANGNVVKDADGKDEERLAILPHIAEAALGHRLKSSDVQDVYDLADYSDEVSDALVLVANDIAKVVGETANNVVKFDEAA